MGQFKKVWHEAKRTYHLDLVGTDKFLLRHGGHIRYFVPRGWDTEAEAQAEADKMNARYAAKGLTGRKCVVGVTDTPAGWGYVMEMRF